MAFVPLNNNELVLAEINTKRLLNKDVVMKCVAIIRRHIVGDISIMNRYHVLDILINSINEVVDDEAEFIDCFNASLVFLMHTYRNYDRLSAVRWVDKRTIEVLCCDDVSITIHDSFYGNASTSTEPNNTHDIVRKAIIECHKSAKMMNELNEKEAYVSTVKKFIDRIIFRKRLFVSHPHKIETSFGISYRFDHDINKFVHDNIITIMFRYRGSEIIFDADIERGIMTMRIDPDNNITNISADIMTYIFMTWIRYLIYPGGDEACDVVVYDRIMKETKPASYLYYMQVSYQNVVSRSFVISRKTTYWWVLNYAVFGDRHGFGKTPVMHLWITEMDKLLKQALKRTIDCIFHSELYSWAFYLLPFIPMSHYSGVVFIDREESVFDHPIYNEWYDHANLFPACKCNIKGRGINYTHLEKDEIDEMPWFHDAMMKGILTIPCVSFGTSQPSSSTDTSIAIPSTPIKIVLHVLHDFPSDGGEILGGGIKFPTITLIEDYTYEFVIDMKHVTSKSVTDKAALKTFSIWHDTGDGRKITVFYTPMTNASAVTFIARQHSKLHYGELEETDWGYIEVVDKQAYVNKPGDFPLFTDHNYCPSIVTEKNRAMTTQPKIVHEIPVAEKGIRLLVFILDRYTGRGDARMMNKAQRNLIYKDIAIPLSGYQNEFIIKYALCDSTDIEKLFTSPRSDRIVGDISASPTIQIENLKDISLLYIIHPHANRKKPLPATLPETLRITVRGKTQIDRLLTAQNHKHPNITEAIVLDTVKDIREIIVSTITMYSTCLNIATITPASKKP